ncbi:MULTISPECIES: hypothetical protein [Aequorivita]|uniref:Uncharacterized protein n=1 Tax=Aequorivita iocasae TaxID=2803865 RepID=A0ABX7DVL5_9FLAO|nr:MULTISPECIES: hypothetical protein [Aequorivita]QQX77832.1 hypothetical protein JK629_06110 [Aequorivita iocasae]UCA57332.1 hypothetical protein LDL78_06140 [Aequorivita sp. F7]
MYILFFNILKHLYKFFGFLGTYKKFLSIQKLNGEAFVSFYIVHRAVGGPQLFSFVAEVSKKMELPHLPKIP